MTDIHITAEILRALDSGKVDAESVTQWVLSHLSQICPTCREELLRFQREPTEVADDGAAMDDVFARVRRRSADLHRELSDERQRSREDYQTLLRLGPGDRLGRVQRARRRFRSPFLAEALLRDCRAALPGAAAEARHFSELAYEVSLRIPAPFQGELMVLSLAHLGNALRADGELRQARRRLDAARAMARQQQLVDSLALAELDWLEAILACDQRRFSASEALFSRSAVLYQLAEDPVSVARTLLSASTVYKETGDLEGAIAAVERAERCLEGLQEPFLSLCAIHNRLFYLAEGGQFGEAREGLAAVRHRYREFPEPWTQLRLSWLESKVAAGFDRLAEATEGFRATRDGFVAEGKAFDAALVSLELAAVLMRQGRRREVVEVAEEIRGIFEVQAVHREALAALLLLQQAAQEEAVTTGLLADLTQYLERARRDPQLAFQQSA
ncbi:MAG: hypothetical protein AAF604_15440 [Acidobacteriota bacterium]